MDLFPAFGINGLTITSSRSTEGGVMYWKGVGDDVYDLVTQSIIPDQYSN